jgi:hypothetical protein
MTLSELKYKLKNKIHYYLIASHRNEPYEKYISYYCSYRYSLKHENIKEENINYLAARPNPGAGIGHQMANWIAGYWFAKKFGLNFAHIPFSNDHNPFVSNEWDTFLGFGEGEILVSDLLHNGYKKVLLPLFDENRQEQIEIIKKIIISYSNKRAVFICEQDQFLRNQYYVMNELQQKFYSAFSRKNDIIQYNKNHINIAIHVRRTVIIDGKIIKESQEAMDLRWLSEDYYIKVLSQILKSISINKPISIWLFSTGNEEEFLDFKKYGDIHFCSGMNEYQTFAHLIFADILITSKSSFSYKPALICKGIKICPRNFWHGYPDAKDWILCDNDGTFDVKKLDNVKDQI